MTTETERCIIDVMTAFFHCWIFLVDKVFFYERRDVGRYLVKRKGQGGSIYFKGEGDIKMKGEGGKGGEDRKGGRKGRRYLKLGRGEWGRRVPEGKYLKEGDKGREVRISGGKGRG